jgi:hypothetical protein
MRRPGRIVKIILLLLCACGTSSLAQTTGFKYKAALPKVDSAGYYRINLPPQVTAKANADLSDIRLSETGSGYVPYVKTGDLPADDRSKFTVFPQLKTDDKTDTSTIFVIANPTGGTVHQLWLKLKNTAVERQITITGSDDLHQWFAITENINMGTATANDDKGVYGLSIVFPASSYRYLKLVINNRHKSPVNILEAGIYTYLQAKPGFVPIVPVKFARADSANHITHLYVVFTEAYLINKLCVLVKANTYFRREVNVYINNPNHQWLTSKILSNQDTTINLSVKAKSLDIQIINNDDRPLPINKVEAYQSESYIVARLEPNNSYALFFGNNKTRAPQYDLQFFTPKISSHLPEITALPTEKNPDYSVGKVKPADTKPYWLWLSIAVAVCILSALTVTMVKELGKRN